MTVISTMLSSLSARMDEKITQISHELPAFLVEHKGLYGILSKGHSRADRG